MSQILTEGYKSAGEMLEVFNNASTNGFIRNTESAGKLPVVEMYDKEVPSFNPEIFNASDGYLQTIDTLTSLRGKIIDTIFYNENITDSVSLISEGGWADKLDTLKGDFVGDDLESGFYDNGNNGRGNNSKNVDAQMSKISIPILDWSKGYDISISQINQSSIATGRSILSVKERALSMQWQLLVQQVALIGTKDKVLKGVNTLSDVTLNTSAMTKTLSAMTAAEIQSIVGTLLKAYVANNPSASGDGNSMPDTFRIPFSDYLGLSASRSDYVDMTKLGFIENAFKEQTSNANFKILGSKFNEKATMTGFVTTPYDRYALYKKDSILLSIPVDLMYATVQDRPFKTRTDGMGRISSVYAERPAEAIYFDNANS